MGNSYTVTDLLTKVLHPVFKLQNVFKNHTSVAPINLKFNFNST